MLQKLKMKDLLAWVLVITNISSFVETHLVKSLKALRISKWLLEVMSAPKKSAVAPKDEALTSLELSLASIVSLIVKCFGSFVLCVPLEETSTRARAKTSYLLFLLKALTPSSLSISIGAPTAWHRGDLLGDKGTSIPVTRGYITKCCP